MAWTKTDPRCTSAVSSVRQARMCVVALVTDCACLLLLSAGRRARRVPAIPLSFLSTSTVGVTAQICAQATALHLAAADGHAETVSVLLDHGADGCGADRCVNCRAGSRCHQITSDRAVLHRPDKMQNCTALIPATHVR